MTINTCLIQIKIPKLLIKIVFVTIIGNSMKILKFFIKNFLFHIIIF